MYFEVKLASAKLVVFDFDQTITVYHIFKLLAKDATTELGQMRLIDDLNAGGDYSGDGGFANWAVGGAQRLAQLRRFFTTFRERGVCLVVCTFGLVGTVKKLLGQLELLEFFTEVYGGGPYKYKPTAYDKSLSERGPTADEEKLLAAPELGKWKTKGDVIGMLRQKMRLGRSEVIFIDDDINMLSDASGLCWTIWVKMSKGMGQEHLDEIDWRTRPSRIPWPVLSCLEPLACLQLSWHTHLQLKDGAEFIRSGR